MQLIGLSAIRERTGATTLTAKYLADSLGQGLTDAAPGDFEEFVRTNVKVDQDESGNKFIVTATYEGGDAGEEDGGGSRYDTDPRAVYDWSPSFEQQDILTHPRIGDLLEKYEGIIDVENGTIRWAEEATQTTVSGLSKKKTATQVKNPMLGVREFLSLGGIWSVKKIRSSIPSNIFTKVGKIVEQVPGQLPSPGNRFWLTMPPAVSQRGNKWEVTERWMLSGVDSPMAVEAAKDIYEQNEASDD